MESVYKYIEEYNPNRKGNPLIVFHYVIPNIISKKKLNQIVTEKFNTGRKLNISVFIAKSYFQVPDDLRLNCTNFLIMKIPNKSFNR